MADIRETLTVAEWRWLNPTGTPEEWLNFAATQDAGEEFVTSSACQRMIGIIDRVGRCWWSADFECGRWRLRWGRDG